MKKVLVIVYYWPPSGGGGVQRWIKLCNLLLENGWQPLVYIPKDPDYPLIDESLAAEVSPQVQVIKYPIWEPRKLYNRLFGKKQQTASPTTTPSADEIFYHDRSERSWKQNLALWIRGNLFIPDARSPWIRPSIRFLTKYLKENPVDAVISSGPPHSLHLIGRGLKRRLDIPWIADFRDAWTEIEFFDKLMLSSWASKRHHKLERAVLAEADLSMVTADYWIEPYQARGARRVELLLNGYDERDFPSPRPPVGEAFAISHVGTLAYDRNPTQLWQALRELCDEVAGFSESLQVHFAGKTDSMVKASLAEMGMGDKIHDHGYISHQEAIQLMCTSPLLLLLINQSEKNAQGRVPGKVFEYLAAMRPILCIGPQDSSIDHVLQEAGAGRSIPFADKEQMKTRIRLRFEAFKAGDNASKASSIEAFSRQALARKLSRFLAEITD